MSNANQGGWKERPRRFLEPSLVTSQECLGYKQATRTELRHATQMEKKALDDLGGEEAVFGRPNGYYDLFRKDGAQPVSSEHAWTLDRVLDNTTYDQSVPRDTFHTRHTQAARKRCTVSLDTKLQLRTSQAYGWLPAIDEPKLGFGRSSIFLDSSMDKSHIRCGGPWSAR